MTEPEGAGKAADPPHVDRHVDPGAQSQVWRADDVLVDISPGDWIAPALPSFDYTVGSLVPPAFTLYSRILHPAKRLVRGTGVRIPVRWAEVAEFTGGVIHQTVEWGSLLHAGIRRGVGDGRGTLWDESPGTGEMPQDRYAALAEVLAEHTTTPDSCWFGFWDGRVSSMRLPDSVPRLHLPGRDYYLVHGRVRDAVRTLGSCGPNLWWPQDRAWFVVSEIDLMSTYVGSSTAAALALSACAALEVIDTADSRRVAWDSDHINPLPPKPYGR